MADTWTLIHGDVQNTRGLPWLVKQEFGFIWDGKGWMKEVVISDG